MKPFSKEYFEGGKQSNYRSYKNWEKVIRGIYFSEVLKNVNVRGARVLDIGCAYGYFLKCCDEIGCETYGIDISEYAINQAKKETNAKLFVHDVDKGLPMFEDDSFDLVTMFDVIEHLHSPYFVLKEIYRVLKVSGKIIITTPNLNAIDRFLKKVLRKEKTWHGFRDKTHLYLFTPSSLRFLVERVGFKVVKLETPFHPLLKPLQKIVNKTGLGGQIWLVGEK
ncbi:class I SAM-dependent methyltransferase [Methanocaldococcus sp.]|uniref:class I SAM-dependent methyltransferase n=1 Tax=Methanocaldococcus sp. TaxID=2152917 RepID=UPI0026217F55|nr:class I SAM-dependent methyltransferase [Methanocaldococcus sp.]MCQ6254489.1 class I SAM-dependent methyltransferase [Methanocaldococcus sp.]